MRWYVTINGQTHGPVDESVLRSWVRQKQVPPGSVVAPEGQNSSWVPIEKSSFAPQPSSWIAVAILAALCLMAFVIWSPEKSSPAAMSAVASPTPKATATERAKTTCILSIPGSRDQVLLFPTEAGIDEFGKAAASGDEQAMQIAMRSNGGVFVDAGTKCTWLDVGFARTKVRVVEGPRAGLAGHVPTEWASGR